MKSSIIVEGKLEKKDNSPVANLLWPVFDRLSDLALLMQLIPSKLLPLVIFCIDFCKNLFNYFFPVLLPFSSVGLFIGLPLISDSDPTLAFLFD